MTDNVPSAKLVTKRLRSSSAIEKGVGDFNFFQSHVLQIINGDGIPGHIQVRTMIDKPKISFDDDILRKGFIQKNREIWSQWAIKYVLVLLRNSRRSTFRHMKYTRRFELAK
jgi:hypothetical protein